MKSKVILVCVLIFCSKIVDSIPHSENHVRQRANPPSNWQVNKNVPNAQYLDTGFTQMRNVNKLSNSAIQLENNEDYYSNQRGYNYDSYGYNKRPASSPSAVEVLVNYDSPADGRRLDTYPPRLESYPSHTSQVGFEHLHNRNQKWRLQNSFTNSVPSSVLIPDDENPLTSVQEPYQGVTQYLQPKYVPSTNRRFYQPERSYPTREQFQYTSVDHSSDGKYVVNPATRFGSRTPVPYENYKEGQASETKTRPIGVHRHVQNFGTPSEINYETSAVEFPETVADEIENMRYEQKSRLRSHLRNAAPITSHDDVSSVTSETDNYSSDLRPSNLAPVVNVIKDATVEISKIVDHKPLAHKHVHRSESGWSNIARDNSYNDAPTDITETVEVKEGNYGANYAEEKAFAINTYPEYSPTPTVLENSESNTYAESNAPKYGSSSPNKSKQNAIHHLTSGIKELSLKSLVANPEIQHILARTNKRYVVVHLNGTIEYLDTLPLDSQRDSNLRLVHTKRKNIDGSEGEVNGVLTPQSPQNLPSNIHKTTTAPVDEYLWPTNYEPTDQHDSNPVITLKNLPVGQNHFKKIFPHAEQPADTENFKLLPTPVNQSTEDIYSKPLTPTENQPGDDSNSNQPKDDNHSNSLYPNEVQQAYYANTKPTYENQSEDNNNSKPLPYDVNQPKDDDILKHWTSPENQPRDNDHSKPLLKDVKQSFDEINLNPYARNPVHVNRHKHTYVAHPANDNTLTVLLPNETRPSDGTNYESFKSTQPANDTKPKHSHGNQPENDDSSNPPSPNRNQSAADKKTKPLTSFESQLADDNDSKLLHLYKRKAHNHHHYQLKSRHSHEDQPLDDDNLNPISTLVSLTNTENQPGDVYTAKPLPSNDNKSGDDANSKRPNKKHTVYHTKSKHLYGNQPEEDDNSKPSFPVVNQPANDDNSEPFNENLSADNIVPKAVHPYYRHHKKSKHSQVNKPADDNNSNPGSTPEPLDYPKDQPRDDNPAQPLPTNKNRSGDKNLKHSKPLDTNENQSGDEIDSEPLPPHKRYPAHRHKPRHFYDEDSNSESEINQPAEDKKSEPLPANENDISQYKQSGDDNTSKTLDENQSEDETNSTLLPPHKKQQAHHKKSKHLHDKEQANDNNSNPSLTPEPFDYPEDQLGDDNTAKPLPTNKNRSGDNKHSKPLDTNENQSGDEIDSEPLPPHKRSPAHRHKTRHFYDDDSNSKSEINQPAEDKKSETLPANKNDISQYKQPGDDNTSKTLDENQSGDETDSTLLPPHKIQQAHHKKSKHLHDNKQANDNNSNPSLTPEPFDYPEDQPGDDNPAKPLPTNKNPSGDNKHSKPLDTNENQSGDEIDSEPLPPHKRSPAHRHKTRHFYDDDSNSKSEINQPAEDKKSETLPANKNDISQYKQPGDDNTSKTLEENQSGDETDSTLLPPHKIQQAHHKKSKHLHYNKQANDNTSNPSLTPEPFDYPEDQPGDDNPAKPLPINKNRSGDNKYSKALDTNENQSGDEIDSEPLPPHKRYPAHRHKPRHFYDDDSNSESEINQPAEDKKSEPLPANENDISQYKQPGDDNTSKTLDENQSGGETDSTLLPPHKIQQAHYKKSKHSHANKLADDNNSNPVPPGADHQTNDTTSKPLHPNEVDGSPVKQPEDDKNAKNLPLNENQSESDIDSEPLLPHKKPRAHHYQSKPKQLHVNLESADDNSNSDLFGSAQDENQPGDGKAVKSLPSNKNQSEDETDTTPSPSHIRQRPRHNKPKNSHVNLESDDHNSNPSNQDENQPRDDKAGTPLPYNEIKSGDETVTTPLAPQKKQRAHRKKPKHVHVNKSEDDNNSKISPDETQLDDKKSTSLPTSKNQLTNDNNSAPEENLPEDDIKSKPLPASENKPTDDLNSKPSPSLSSKNDDESKSMTLSPSVLNYTATPKPQDIRKYKRKYRHRKTTTVPPVVSTTPSPDDSSEDQIITLSPIEQVTDNVGDVTPKPQPIKKHKRKYRHGKTTTITTVVSTTPSPDDSSEDQIITLSPIEQVTNNVGDVPTLTKTTAKPIETPDKKDTYKDDNNKLDEAQDDTKSSSEDLASISDKIQTSTTTATPSSSTTTTDAASDDKTKEKSEENENKAVVSKENNGKDDTETGDASGDNSSELEQSETDVTITVSSSTTHDSEDDIITINIGVSESTDDADSPSSDKTLVVNIDTNPENDDESKTLKTDVFKNTETEDCKGDHDYDDDTGKNVEIDLSNLKGEPIIWIKTTNQDIIDKLTSNDTQFDVVYFFNIENQTIIEREKETIIYCNGTVVIETTEITYAHKDDSTPTIVKTTEIMQIEDYELHK